MPTTDPLPRLRDRLTEPHLAAAARGATTVAEMFTRLCTGLPVLACVTRPDGCYSGLLVEDGEGVWPLVLADEPGLLDNTVGGVAARAALAVSVAALNCCPDVLAAILALVPPDQTRLHEHPDEWVEALLIVAYLDSGHERATQVQTMLGLGRPLAATRLQAVRRVYDNLPYRQQLLDTFRRALDNRGLTDVNMQTALLAAEDRQALSGIWQADQEDWLEEIHRFLELWQADGLPGHNYNGGYVY